MKVDKMLDVGENTLELNVAHACVKIHCDMSYEKILVYFERSSTCAPTSPIISFDIHRIHARKRRETKTKPNAVFSQHTACFLISFVCHSSSFLIRWTFCLTHSQWKNQNNDNGARMCCLNIRI